MSRAGRVALAGAGVWLLLGAFVQPAPGTPDWPLWLQAFAILVTTPLALGVAELPFSVPAPAFAAAGAAAAAATAVPSGAASGALAAPWLLLAAWHALPAVGRWSRGAKSLEGALVTVGVVQWTVGAAWHWAGCAGVDPFGFGWLVGRLTAAHFHVAGLALPVLTACVLRTVEKPSAADRGAAVVVAGGVAAVAGGIVVTRLGGGHAVEGAAATLLSLACLWLGARQIHTGWRRRWWAWLLSGSCLVVAMSLALAFAVRAWLPWAWLSLPRMWTLHGSLQLFGFALTGLLHATRAAAQNKRRNAANSSSGWQRITSKGSRSPSLM